MKKMLINNRLYEVTTMEDYTDNKSLYNPKFTAIENNNGQVLPIKSKNDTGVGVYYQDDAMVAIVNKPKDNDNIYDSKNIIDYSNPKDIGEIINKENIVRDIENELLTTKENIFNLKIGNEDTPEMKAVKQAINLKQIDIRQYEQRFDQYQNDIRLLKGKSITLGKLVSTCTNFDISAELVLKDKEGCANPMNSEIRIDLTEGRGQV